MKVLSYKVILPNNEGIVEALDRSDYMTYQYIDLVEDYLAEIKLDKPTAFLYAGGATVSSSESRNTQHVNNYRETPLASGLALRELVAYSMHKWIGMIQGKENIIYANINGNTCASSMHSLYEAERLLNSGDVDEVIIVAEEKTSYNTLRVFDESRIDLKVGEGLVIIHLGKAESPATEDITNCKWFFEYNKNPFNVTSTGYREVFDDTADFVKPHGTGTTVNEVAESSVYVSVPTLRYKEDLGHTQGISGLLEACLVLQRTDIIGTVNCVSSGLGGFYGSCIVHKR